MTKSEFNWSKRAYFYERHLFDDVVPFWTKNCVDWECGGINNVVKDDGTILSTDKYLWSQGRALWTFSALYNYFGRKQEWLDIAECIYNFILKNGRSEDGYWVYCLHRDGSIADIKQSIYADLFVCMGMTEYARATKNEEALLAAKEVFHRVSPMLEDQSTLPTAPLLYPSHIQSHGPLMSYAHVFHELGVLNSDEKILKRALELAERIITQHVKIDKKLLFEFVKPGGELLDDDYGKTVVPGHVIESMWFIERIYNYHKMKDRAELTMDIVRWHMEFGWDEEYDGIMLSRHSEGGTSVWHKPDTKPWWPQTEALYALIRAYQLDGQDWSFNWYNKVHDYCFSHYPNSENGDWHHNLDRKGEIIPTIALIPVKDPFHLPRALIYSISAIRKMVKE